MLCFTKIVVENSFKHLFNASLWSFQSVTNLEMMRSNFPWDNIFSHLCDLISLIIFAVFVYTGSNNAPIQLGPLYIETTVTSRNYFQRLQCPHVFCSNQHAYLNVILLSHLSDNRLLVAPLLDFIGFLLFLLFPQVEIAWNRSMVNLSTCWFQSFSNQSQILLIHWLPWYPMF